MRRSRNYCAALTEVAALLCCAAVIGCGWQPGVVAPVSDDRSSVIVATIDWQGGASALTERELGPVRLDEYLLDDGGTLALFEGQFKQRVVDEIALIFGGVGTVELVIANGEETDGDSFTQVMITQAVGDEPNQFGRADFDPCDAQRDNVAVVFAGELLRLSDPYPLDDWVHLFANAIAHELAHTIGFDHVDRVVHAPDARDLYVELMYDGHTMAEMRRPQRFLVKQDPCVRRQSARTIATERACLAH